MDLRKIISINLIFVLIMAISGISFGLSAHSSALLTDGTVSLVIFFSSSLGILIHTILNHNDDYLYPFGKWRFEYVYNFIRLMILTTIIIYSLFEASHTIINYLINNLIPEQVSFNSILLYFPLKLSAALLSLLWLRYNKNQLDDEYYSVERDSVLVDTLLTIAIFIGFTVFSNISTISEIADSITLLLISIILLTTIISELKHLIFILIGRRMYVELEQSIIEKLQTEVDFQINDVHIEKFGIVYIVFITCSFTTAKTVEQLEQLDIDTQNILIAHDITKFRTEFSFKQ